MEIHFEDMKFIFDTQSKKQVIGIFDWKCKNIYKLDSNDLILIDEYLSLPIIMDKWKDIDDENSYHNIFKALYKITDPRGGRPGTILSSILTGYDKSLNMHFVFVGEYFGGQHTIVGYYDNGQQVIYQDKLILTDKVDKKVYDSIFNKWRLEE